MPLDPHSHVPIYEQIVEHIRDSVAAGVYRPQEPLPSIRELAVQLIVNPNTVQRAYQELERQGLITTRRGLGAFVADNGNASAQSRSETAVLARFNQAIAVARAAGMTDDQVKSIFQRALEANASKHKKTDGAGPTRNARSKA